LPTPEPKPSVPYCAKMPCPEYPYHERSDRIGCVHYSVQKEVLGLYRWLHDRWILKWQDREFVDTVLEGMNLPLSLEDFRKAQTLKSEATQLFLQRDFRRTFMDQFLDSCQDLYDFFQSNVTVYEHGGLFKLFRVLDLKLSDMLRTLMVKSLDIWSSYVSSRAELTIAPEGMVCNVPVDATSPSEILKSVENGVEESKDTNVVPPVDTAKAVAASSRRSSPRSGRSSRANSPRAPRPARIPLTKRTTELNFPFECHAPLFASELTVKDFQVVIEPSPEDIEEAFLHALDMMIKNIQDVESVDSEAKKK
jgi:hypothetical protein